MVKTKKAGGAIPEAVEVAMVADPAVVVEEGEKREGGTKK